jgi:tetratricopeptide (TPR) repeat protein
MRPQAGAPAHFRRRVIVCSNSERCCPVERLRSSCPLSFLVLGLGGSLLLSTPLARGAERRTKGENYAFLVGVGDYDVQELKPLKYASNDIKGFYQALLDSGFRKENIVLMNEEQKPRFLPEGKKIRGEFTRFLARLEKEDTVIVAFSGHGVQFKNNKTSYFCPLDTKLKDRSSLIALDWVYSRLAKSPARRKLLLVDACRNDPQSDLPGSKGALRKGSLRKLVSHNQPVPKRIVALFSCTAGQKAFEHPDLKHSVFFYYLIQGWKGRAANGDGEVTFDGLAAFAKKKTKDYVYQSLKDVQTPEQRNSFDVEWVIHKPNLGLLQFTQGMKALERKAYDLAISRFSEAIRRNPRYAPAYLRRAWTYTLKKDYDQAIRDYTRVLAINPQDVGAYQGRGNAYFNTRNYALAVTDYDQVIKRRPKSALTYNDRGAAYSWLGNTSQALLDYSKAIRLKPDYALAYRNRGHINSGQKKYTLAIADFTKAISLTPGDSLSYRHWAGVFLTLKNYDNAIADYTKAIDRNPNDAVAFNERGVAYLGKKDLKAALLDYSQAIRIDSNYALAYRNRAILHERRKHYNRALQDYSAAIRLNRQDAFAYLWRGNIYNYHKKAYARAIRDYSAAIGINPRFALAYNNRGNSYHQLKKYSRAIREFNRAIRFDRKFAFAYVNRGWAYYQKKVYGKALGDANRALRVKRHFGPAYLLRSYAFKGKGKNRLANRDQKLWKRYKNRE